MSLLSTYASPYNESSTISDNLTEDSSNQKNIINRKRQNKTIKKKPNNLGSNNRNKTSSRVTNMIETLKQYSGDDDDDLEDFEAPPYPESAAIERKDNADNSDNLHQEYDSSTFAKQSENTENNLSSDSSSVATDNSTDNSVEKEAFNSLQGGYAEQYVNQFVPYYQDAANGGNINKLNGDVNEKLNYLIHLMEEQKDEKTGHVTEELVLYSFLGVFVIYVIDSFARVGKYVR